MEKKKRIAIVVQRYGEEINGGAEQHARRIAERLVDSYDVTVLTSTARELNWNPYYEEGESELNRVRIFRFCCCPINKENRLYDRGMIELIESNCVDEEKVTSFSETKGPNSPELIHYIEKNKDKYEAFLFVTYLFYQTVKGIPLVANKAIFLPTAHDEPYIYFYEVYARAFCNVRDILFNSVEEQRLVHRIYRNENVRNMVVGEGVDTPQQVNPQTIKDKYRLNNYILYVGRVTKHKQCDLLIDFFCAYKKLFPSDLKLVIIGRSDLPVINNDDIVFTGFVTDQEKFDAMAGAKLLVMPSLYESLCMAVLEALSIGTPVLVNAKCAVIRGHCIRGNCGLYYRDFDEFTGCLNYMLGHDDVRKAMGMNGIEYIKENYNWDNTINRINDIMNDYN